MLFIGILNWRGNTREIITKSGEKCFACQLVVDSLEGDSHGSCLLTAFGTHARDIMDDTQYRIGNIVTVFFEMDTQKFTNKDGVEQYYGENILYKIEKNDA